jgi:putative sterol carrier protein
MGTLPSNDDIVADLAGEWRENGLTMANEDECRTALGRIAERLTDVDEEQFAEHVVERTVSCRVPDLDLAFETRIHAGGLDPFKLTDEPKTAQVRITVNSDDLVALSTDELHAARAWASGRLKVEASIFDLLRLRKLL